MSSDVVILFILHCLGNICFGCSSVGISHFSSCRGFECSSSQVVECSSCRVFRVLRFRVFELSSFRDFEFSNHRVLLGSGTDKREGLALENQYAEQEHCTESKGYTRNDLTEIFEGGACGATRKPDHLMEVRARL